MDPRCILFTITFVVNVSPIMTAAEYANAVYITNKYIEKAFREDAVGLETAISNIINGDKTIEIVNMMLVVPESANIFNIDYQGEEFIENLPETIAIPDQLAVREAIHRVTNLDVPQLEPNQIIENDSLPQLGEDRRHIIVKVAKKLLFAAIDNGSPRFANLAEICRLIAVLRSIRFPNACIKTATVSVDVCRLTSHDGRFFYSPYYGHITLIWTVGPYRVDNINIKYQVNDWFP